MSTPAPVAASTLAPTPPTPSTPTPATPRFSTKPSYIPGLKDPRRAGIIASISQADDPIPVMHLLREIGFNNPRGGFDIDTPLDSQGHTALHIASSLSRLSIIQALLSSPHTPADPFRGNNLGETPLMRTILSTHAYEHASLQTMLEMGLGASLLTLDTSKRSVLHHVVAVAGVKGRGVVARYYLDQILSWVAGNDAAGGAGTGLSLQSLSSLIDLQDEHGDTPLNIAARVGSKTLVRTLLDVGARKDVANRMGLRPGDWGVDVEVYWSISLSWVVLTCSLGTIFWTRAQVLFPRRRTHTNANPTNAPSATG